MTITYVMRFLFLKTLMMVIDDERYTLYPNPSVSLRPAGPGHTDCLGLSRKAS